MYTDSSLRSDELLRTLSEKGQLRAKLKKLSETPCTLW